MPLTRAIISLVCAAVHAAAWLPQLAAQTAELDSVSRYVVSEMKRQHIPGLSLAILRGDRVLLARGYGFANLELRVPASDSTVYQSGSLGKQFAGVAVAMLSRQGRLGLDQPITTWLTEGRGLWDSVTVRQLLTHTGGIPEYTDSIDLRKDYTEDQLVRFASTLPLDFPPGQAWSYSNTGYALLGVIVRRATGRFYGDVLHQLLFAPLGMGTRIISEADIVPNRAAGYRLVGDVVKNQEWVAPSLNTTADGALYLTVNDLAKWAVALNHRLPDSEVLDAAWTPVRLTGGGTFPYGYGWDLRPQRGQARVGHTGAWQGFKAAFYRYPESGLTVAVLANLDLASPGRIAQGIAGILQPSLQPPHRMAKAIRGPVPPTPIQELLRRAAAGSESGLVTPGVGRFLLPAAREELAQTLREVDSWTALGCEPAPGGKVRWLGADAVRVCYARGTGKSARTVATVFYTDSWQATYFDYESF